MTEYKEKVSIRDGKIIWGWWGETKWWLRRRRGDLIGIEIWTIDRLPWFARKRLFSWRFGINWGDFQAADALLSGEQRQKREPLDYLYLCIKW